MVKNLYTKKWLKIFLHSKMTIKWSKNFYTKSDCENVFGLKMTINRPPPLYDVIKKWHLTNEKEDCVDYF